MKNLTIENIEKACGGKFCGDPSLLNKIVEGVSIDSRKIQPGYLFIPLKGERVDGHDFIDKVMETGLITLSEKDLGEKSYPYIFVESTAQALKDIAEFYLKGLDVQVVGITGSVGKTSTKEAIYAMLSVKYKTAKTEGNFNNEIGLPLTVLSIKEDDEMAVIEMGISDFGEMTRLAQIARPNVGVFTNIGTCHLENLKSRDGVFKAKTEMLEYVKDLVVVNGDDDKLKNISTTKDIIYCGLKDKNDFYATNILQLGFEGSSCTVHGKDFDIDVVVPVPGIHNVQNALMAAAIGDYYGLTPEEIKKGIENYKTIKGRFFVHKLSNRIVVDDCYNANPMSMKASLDILSMSKGRRVAILGDMGELGEDELKLHEEVGKYVGKANVDLLIAIGERSKYMADEAKKYMEKVVHFDNVKEALDGIFSYITTNDVILVKASHFMNFDKIVDILTK